MPTVAANGLNYFYEEAGSGSPVVFAHGLTFDRHMWDHQVQTLSPRYRCIAVDLRGHGGSGTAPGDYSLEDEAESLHALMGQLGARPAHLVGLSLGGMIGLRLALAHPEAVRSLALLDTSAEAELPERAPQYEALAATAKAQGPGSVVGAVLPIMFSQAFLQGQPEAVARYQSDFGSLNLDGLEAATKAVSRRTDILGEISRIGVPALVIVGEKDIATTPDKAQHIVERIAGARLKTIPGSGHMTPIEQPELVSQLLSEFLAEVDAGSPK